MQKNSKKSTGTLDHRKLLSRCGFLQLRSSRCNEKYADHPMVRVWRCLVTGGLICATTTGKFWQNAKTSKCEKSSNAKPSALRKCFWKGIKNGDCLSWLWQVFFKLFRIIWVIVTILQWVLVAIFWIFLKFCGFRWNLQFFNIRWWLCPIIYSSAFSIFHFFIAVRYGRDHYRSGGFV